MLSVACGCRQYWLVYPTRRQIWQAAEKLIWSAVASVARHRFGSKLCQAAGKSKAPPLSAHSKFVVRRKHYEFFSSLPGTKEKASEDDPRMLFGGVV
jgi:hypothetical protein